MRRLPLWTLVKHQAGAALATLVDFSVMVTGVEIGGLGPVSATAVGASCGAVTSFLLGRNWIFDAQDGRIGAQAFRYALVSAGSLVLNSLGELAATRGLAWPYVRARIVVAALVGVAWNFPLHRWFVFRRSPAAPS